MTAEQKEQKRQYMVRYYAKNKDRIREYRAKNAERYRELERGYRKDGRYRKLRKEYHQKYYAKNGDKIKEQARGYYAENREQRKEAMKKFHADNPNYKREYNAAYYAKTRRTEELRSQKRRYMKQRRVHDAQFRMVLSLRRRVLACLQGKNKSASTLELIGGIDNLKAHLQSQFKPDMNWENRGTLWHIDHVRPVSSFDLNDPSQQRACFHYSNLQPLYWWENVQKSWKFSPSSCTG